MNADVYSFIEIDNDEKTSNLFSIMKKLEPEFTGSPREFLRQTFHPELIEKYFEGWVLYESIDGLEHLMQKEPFVSIKIFDDSVIYTIITSGTYRRTITIKTFLPETLNDFIRDCKRAVIELKWRVK